MRVPPLGCQGKATLADKVLRASPRSLALQMGTERLLREPWAGKKWEEVRGEGRGG